MAERWIARGTLRFLANKGKIKIQTVLTVVQYLNVFDLDGKGLPFFFLPLPSY